MGVWDDIVVYYGEKLLKLTTPGKVYRFMTKNEPALWIMYNGFKTRCKMSTTVLKFIDLDYIESALYYYIELDVKENAKPVDYLESGSDPICNDVLVWYEFEAGFYRDMFTGMAYRLYEEKTQQLVDKAKPYYPYYMNEAVPLSVEKTSALACYQHMEAEKAELNKTEEEALFTYMGLRAADYKNPRSVCGVVVLNAIADYVVYKVLGLPVDILEPKLEKKLEGCDSESMDVMEYVDLEERCEHAMFLYGINPFSCIDDSLEIRQEFLQKLVEYGLLRKEAMPEPMFSTSSIPMSITEKQAVIILSNYLPGLPEEKLHKIYRAVRYAQELEQLWVLYELLRPYGISYSLAVEIYSRLVSAGVL